MYLPNVIRPNISFAVYNLAQLVSNPGKAHCCALKHLLRFLKCSEYSTDKDDRKSTSGICFNEVVLVVLSLGRPKSKGVWHLALVKLRMFLVGFGCTGSSLFARLLFAHTLLFDDGGHACSVVR